MFCKNCGKEIDDSAVICPNCGVQVGRVTTTSQPQSEGNTIAIVGFIFAFLIPFVGFICSIIGLNKAKKEGAPYKGLAIAGLIISLAIIVFYIILYAAVIAAAASGV